MRAVVYSEPEKHSLLEVPAPVAQPGEVVLQVTMTGVCGTDVHIHHGEFGPTYPLIAGHEILGKVVALGAGVTSLALGDRVVYDTMIACGVCAYCQRQLPNYCTDIRAVGVNTPGGFAEYTAAPASRCHSVDGIDDDVAVFAEPLACSMHAMDTLAMKPGSSVLLFGAGPSGLLLAQLLRHGGAGLLVVAAPTEGKLVKAEEFAADATVVVPRDNIESARQALLSHAEGGYDIVINASGSANVLQNAMALVRDGGTVMVYGMVAEGVTIELEPYEIFRRQITIKGTFSQAYSFERAIRMMRSGRIRTDGLITHRFGLTEFDDAINSVASDKSAIKTVVVP